MKQDCLKSVINKSYSFNSLSLKETDEEISDKRAIGPLMRVAQREGWIKPTSKFQPSRVVSHHATPRRVWKSKIAVL